MSTFQDFRKFAYQMVDDMECELAVMERMHRKYEKHGAVKAAKALEVEIEMLREAIKIEEHLLGVAFD